MSTPRQPKMWAKRRFRLPLDWRLDIRVLRHGRCTPDECGYGNVWCRNGCEEREADVPCNCGIQSDCPAHGDEAHKAKGITSS